MSFNPLLSGADTATSTSTDKATSNGASFQSPVEWGGYCNPAEWMTAARESGLFQSPVEWGGYCNATGANYAQNLADALFQSPVEWGGYCNLAVNWDGRNQDPVFQSPVEWGGYCNIGREGHPDEGQIRVSIPC